MFRIVRGPTLRVLWQIYSTAVSFVTDLFNHDQKFGDMETLMQRVLSHCNDHDRDSPEMQMIALHHTRHSFLLRDAIKKVTILNTG